MPYFSFSLVNNYNAHFFQKCEIDASQIKPNIKYFSKNTALWQMLNHKKYIPCLNYLKQEKREKIKRIDKNILICLPPSIGLGDSVEYALSIRAIVDSGNFKNIGVAFVGRYKSIFEKYFNINNVYEEVISSNSINKYDTIFHITLEIKELLLQKYDRQNIEELITNYFGVPKFRAFIKKNNNPVKKISIFPISSSPIRTMPIDLINLIIIKFIKKIDIEIILDNQSEISNFIEKKINYSNVKTTHPKNLNELLITIENINYGIFVDSGPLHIAKILNKKGILISSSVGQNKLLADLKSIQCIDNNYQSFYCIAPCGLVNIFNYNNKIGCYDSLKVSKTEILKHNNLKALQRGDLKKNYINLISNPVNCLKNINKKKVIDKIQESITN